MLMKTRTKNIAEYFLIFEKKFARNLILIVEKNCSYRLMRKIRKVNIVFSKKKNETR